MPEYAAFSNALGSSVLQGVHEHDTQQDNTSVLNPTRKVVFLQRFCMNGRCPAPFEDGIIHAKSVQNFQDGL